MLKKVLLLSTTSLLLSALGVAAATLPAPDYSQMTAWAAFPGRASHANDMPAGVTEKTSTGVAVFFVHPTTYLSPLLDNAAFDADGGVGERIDNVVLMRQASAFNSCCDIYAPRYRQASLRAITTNSPEAYAIDDLAYSDVNRAFDAFLSTVKDRPFILASHSQGSIHALRLLQQHVIGTPLQSRMVAAYLIGVALPQDIAQLGMPICDAPERTGCVLTWNSVAEGHTDKRRLEDAVIWWQGKYQPVAGRPVVCVNPLDWHVGSSVSAQKNLGAIYIEERNAPMAAPLPQLTPAKCENGLLGVDVASAQRKHFRDLLTIVGVYHDFDYSLFYMNIRENALARSRAWLAAQR